MALYYKRVGSLLLLAHQSTCLLLLLYYLGHPAVCHRFLDFLFSASNRIICFMYTEKARPSRHAAAAEAAIQFPVVWQRRFCAVMVCYGLDIGNRTPLDSELSLKNRFKIYVLRSILLRLYRDVM